MLRNKKFQVGDTVSLNQTYGGHSPGVTGKVTGVTKSMSSEADLVRVEYTDRNGRSERFSCYSHRLDLITAVIKSSRLKTDGRIYRGHSSAAIRRVGTIARLLKAGSSIRGIAAKLGLSKSAVGRVAQRIAA